MFILAYKSTFLHVLSETEFSSRLYLHTSTIT